jgi:hypothetical protein
MLELYRYWTLLPQTQEMLKGMVDGALTEMKRGKPHPLSAAVGVISDEDEPNEPLEDQSAAPCLVVEPVDRLEDSLSGSPLPSQKTSALNLKLSSTLKSSPDDSEAERTLSSLPPPTPTSPFARSLHPHSGSGRALSPRDHTRVQHVVDELDAAHRRGGLSPRLKDLSPQSPENNQRAVSPMEFSLTPQPSDFHPVRVGVSRSLENLARRNSARSLATESNASSRSSSPEPASTGAHVASSVDLAVIPQTPAFPVATVQDIPPFHFARGKPMVTSGPIVLEAAQILPNAPPMLPPAVQAQQQLLLQQMAASGATSSLFANGILSPPQPVIIPALSAMAHSEVEGFVTKAFAAIKATPVSTSAAGSAALARRSLKNGSTSRKNSLSVSKTDAIYWQHVNSTMHRLTTQCFGLPGYFSRLITAAILKKEAMSEGPTTPPSPALGPVPGKGLTAAQVLEFYETHLRNVPIVRRMFNVLIASSKAIYGPQPTGPGVSKNAPAPLLPENRNFLVREDFVLPLEVLMELHPGLSFLRQAVDFQSKYIETVIHRIFYELDLQDRGRISWSDFERSKLPQTMRQVDVMEEINSVLNFFSYEHFYVLYCRFWELDEDKDLHLSPKDLERYAPEGCLNPAIIDRVFKGYGRRLTSGVPGKMNYEDFVYFCLSEEDKSSPRSIRYWFRILDIDGDGILSGYELETFYNFTKQRMIAITSECIQFPDVMCQIRDMLPFENTEGPSLADLLHYPQSAFVALNMITNVAKFLQFEQRDPFVAHQDRLAGGLEKSEWDRFARAEYDRMSQEAGEHE